MAWTNSSEDLIESAWGIIANAYGGDWMAANPEWAEAAIAWRDRYHSYLDALASQVGEPEKRARR